MALSRYANQRDANEQLIVDALVGVGASVERLDTPLDLLVGFRGVNYLLEVKLPLGPRGGKSGSSLTSDQVTFFRTWRGQRCVVRSWNEALMAIGAMGRAEEED